LKPTDCTAPMRRKPAAACSSTDPVFAASPIRDHLTEAARLGIGDQTCQEQSAEPLALEFRRDVDRILDAPAIRRPGVIGSGIGVSSDDPDPRSDDIRKIFRQQRF
jgi:hypothetical protein